MGNPYNDRDGESGRFEPKFPDKAFHKALEDGNQTTDDVATTVGCEYRTAYNRLQRLHEDGEIKRKKLGNTLIWSPA